MKKATLGGNRIQYTEFYLKNLDELLRDCAAQRMQSFFMPELVELSKSDNSIQGVTLSHVIRCQLPSGHTVNLYNHAPSILTSPDYLSANMNNMTADGSMPFPQEEVSRLFENVDFEKCFLKQPLIGGELKAIAFYGGFEPAFVMRRRPNAGLPDVDLGFDNSTVPRAKFLLLGNSPYVHDGPAVFHSNHKIYGYRLL